MKGVLYHLTVPSSPLARCDAVVQEVRALRAHFGGDIVHLYPGRAPGTRFPRRWWGLHRLLYLLRIDQQVHCHHIYNPDPYPFAVLSWLRRPIIYTAAAGAQRAAPAMVRALARRCHTLVVATEDERTLLATWDVANVAVVRPGIELARFSYTPLPSGTSPTLLMASAPWTLAQFESKGVTTLLSLAQEMPDLHLVFLWRGVLVDEMRRRVRAAGLDSRVEVLDYQVDVNAILARVHATVVLAEGDAIIKAYPHSLLESLATGRPVLVSAGIPMAQDVTRAETGVVVESLAIAHLRVAVEQLLTDYSRYQKRVLAAQVGNWSTARVIADYEQIYSAVVP